MPSVEPALEVFQGTLESILLVYTGPLTDKKSPAGPTFWHYREG